MFFFFKSNIMIDVYRKRINVDFLRNSYFKFSLISSDEKFVNIV